MSGFKDKKRLSDEPVEQDDEFAHDGGDGDFEGLAPVDEALVEGAQDGVVA